MIFSVSGLFWLCSTY